MKLKIEIIVVRKKLFTKIYVPKKNPKSITIAFGYYV